MSDNSTPLTINGLPETAPGLKRLPGKPPKGIEEAHEAYEALAGSYNDSVGRLRSAIREISQLNEQLGGTQHRFEQLSQSRNADAAQLEQMQSQIKAFEAEISRLGGVIDDLNGELKTASERSQLLTFLAGLIGAMSGEPLAVINSNGLENSQACFQVIFDGDSTILKATGTTFDGIYETEISLQSPHVTSDQVLALGYLLKTPSQHLPPSLTATLGLHEQSGNMPPMLQVMGFQFPELHATDPKEES